MAHHMMKTSNHILSDRSPLGSTRTSPSAVHQDGGVKHATGALSKDSWKNNITTGTWNTRTLGAAVKLQELTHEMDRYKRNTLGPCELWKKGTNTSMGWISCSQEHREHCHGMSPCLQQAHRHPPEGSPFQHHNSANVCPNVRLMTTI